MAADTPVLEVGDRLYAGHVVMNRVEIESAVVTKVTRGQVKIGPVDGLPNTGMAFDFRTTLTLEQAHGYGRTRRDAVHRLAGELAAQIARLNDETHCLRTLMAECDKELV